MDRETRKKVQERIELAAEDVAGPDAHNAQGTSLAPEDVQRARESVREQDRLAESPPQDVREARERLDQAFRDVQGGPPPAGTPGAEPVGAQGVFDEASIASNTRQGGNRFEGGMPETAPAREAAGQAEHPRVTSQPPAQGHVEVEPAWPQWRAAEAPRRARREASAEAGTAEERGREDTDSAHTVETVIDQFFGIDPNAPPPERGSAPKGGYFDVERSKRER